MTGIAVVNEGPDEEPVVVPIARFSLGEDVETPDTDLVWDLVGECNTGTVRRRVRASLRHPIHVRRSKIAE
nr:hypothetical protein [Candidatus Halobonum tyrrellensis]